MPPTPMTTLVLRRPRIRLAAGPVAATAGSAAGPVESRALLNGAREVLIHHAGEVYRLRHTRNDKLILTK